MRVLILGAAGFIGSHLAQALCRRGELRLADRGAQAISELVLADNRIIMNVPDPGLHMTVRTVQGNVCDPGFIEALFASDVDAVFHLAATLTLDAEMDFSHGLEVNVHALMRLLEQCRRQSRAPAFVFASSISTYGGSLPDTVDDHVAQTPQTSYGTHKAIAELLINDYSRRGFLDGVGIRLPTIVIRPGKPNLAASGFFSNILREPLVGQEAVLPVSRDVRHWFASPRAAVGFLTHAAEIDTAQLGWRRTLSVPGLSATVGEEIEALHRVAGDKAVKLIREEPDERIIGMVAGWPRNFDARRAASLGFTAESSFDEIIRIHIEDELGGRIGG